MYKKYMNKNNGFKIDKTKSLEEQNISNEAKAIFANLYKDYWATDYEKQRIEAKEKWYKKILNSIKKLFSKKNNNKLSVEEINQIEKQKSDGEPYARIFDKEYSKMSKEEKEQTEKFMEELDEKLGLDEDEISYEEYKKIFETYKKVDKSTIKD